MYPTTDAVPEPSRSGYSFRLDDFEGPLDLLLFLIKKNEVSVYDIPIASITEQFLASLASADGIDLDTMTEFYALAATLLYIKSRMLLPAGVDLDDEIEDPRRDLVERLIEYQKYKKLSDLMERKEMEAEWTLERAKLQRTLPFADDELWEAIDVWDLLRSFSSLMGGMSSERIIDMYEEVSISEKVALIYECLDRRESFAFHELVTRPGSVLDVVCAFLAVLEAVKNRIVSVMQHRLFGDIQLRRYEKRRSDGSES